MNEQERKEKFTPGPWKANTIRLWLEVNGIASDPSEASDGADTKAVASDETPDAGHKEVEK